MRHFESPERRKMPRRPLFVDGVISFAGGTRMRCFVQNVSQTGAEGSVCYRYGFTSRVHSLLLPSA